jgi:hypothetical protein
MAMLEINYHTADSFEASFSAATVAPSLAASEIVSPSFTVRDPLPFPPTRSLFRLFDRKQLDLHLHPASIRRKEHQRSQFEAHKPKSQFGIW